MLFSAEFKSILIVETEEIAILDVICPGCNGLYKGRFWHILLAPEKTLLFWI
jgi:hypothetical protein